MVFLNQHPKARPSINREVSSEFRPSQWITDVVPRKSPFVPQMGDEVGASESAARANASPAPFNGPTLGFSSGDLLSPGTRGLRRSCVPEQSVRHQLGEAAVEENAAPRKNRRLWSVDGGRLLSQCRCKPYSFCFRTRSL